MTRPATGSPTSWSNGSSRTRSNGSGCTWFGARPGRQAFFDEVAAEADALADRLRAFCVAMPEPGPERIFSRCLRRTDAGLDAQRDEYLAYAPPSTDVGRAAEDGGDEPHDHHGQGAERRACGRRWRPTRRSW